MSRINRRKFKFKFSVFSILLVICICFLSVGFAAFTSNLSIGEISAMVRVRKDIRITGLTFKEMHNASITYSDFNVKNIYLGLDLNDSDSYSIVNIEVTNLGNSMEAIGGLLNLNSDLTYEFIDYEIGDAICDENDKCVNGIVSNITLKIKYKDGQYNSNNTLHSINSTIDFRDTVTVTLDDNIKDNIVDFKGYVMRDGTFRTKINDVLIDDLYVSSNGRFLTRGVEYKIVNGYLEVYNVDADIYIKTREYDKVDVVEGKGITLEAKWIDEYNVEIDLNGTLTSDLYLRLRREDTYIGDTATSLYNSTYANNPMFYKDQEVFIKYKFLEGDYNLKGSFTVKFRDATKSCYAISDCEFITNHATKQNFLFNSEETKSAVLSTNVSGISLFSQAGSTFNNVKFIISYGVVS